MMFFENATIPAEPSVRAASARKATALRGGIRARTVVPRRLGFNLRDNAFTALDDPEAAQELADSFAGLNWTKILDRLARRVNPLMFERWFRGLCYYWVVDQAEYATDLIFTGREALAGLYRRLLDHAAVNFSAKDILGFLGRRFHPRFDGEVLTDCQKGRHPGARIKHRVKNNWLKMYDKFGWVLRIETVINDPRNSACGGSEPARGGGRWSGAR